MKEIVWNGFNGKEFVFKNRKGIIIFPADKREDGKWLLKTEYFGAFPDLEIEMLKLGFHLVYLENKSGWGSEEDSAAKHELSKELASTYRLFEKCVPVGMSRGGLHAIYLAAYFPQMVSCMYIDAPVLNLLSCPAAVGVAQKDDELWSSFVSENKTTLSELLSYRNHPMDKLKTLLQNNIPVVMVYGDSDTVVPYCENGAILEKYYSENGAILETYKKEGCGHHPHGLEDPKPLVDFILKYC